MSEEQSWFDSAVDFVSDTADDVSEFASETYESVAESEFVQKVDDTVTHSLRQAEDAMDTDDDGSLLDEVGGNWIKDIPVIGDVVAPIGEEIGDFTTDLLGTRETGLFSEAGTYDAETSDTDYQADSEFQKQGGGLGEYINEGLGIGENDPSDLLQLAGAVNPVYAAYGAVGALADMVDGGDDPYVTEDADSGYHDYDAAQASE